MLLKCGPEKKLNNLTKRNPTDRKIEKLSNICLIKIKEMAIIFEFYDFQLFIKLFMQKKL